jgi:peptide/nickel transport system permease protein
MEPTALASRTVLKPQANVRNLWSDAWRRLVGTHASRFGLVILTAFAFMAVLPPVLMPYDPQVDSNLSMRLKPPSTGHPFGTDSHGRGVLTRILHGARVSLGVGVGSVILAVSAGALLGLVSGFLGGQFDLVMMFLMDILLAFPATLLAIALVAVSGPGLRNTLLAISVVSIPIYARIARSTVLSIKQREYVTAARAVGVQESRLLFRHLLPNSLPPLVIVATLGVGSAILETAALGFLGLGAQPPAPEWGAMLADSYQYLTSGSWWVLTFPGLCIMLTVLGFNLVGDGLRDALDPSMRI